MRSRLEARSSNLLSTPRRERLALFLDLENLVRSYAEQGDWVTARLAVAALVHYFERRGVLVTRLASADPMVADRLRFALAHVGVRTFAHRGGPDAADLQLIDCLTRDLPSTCSTVIIGSGDHIFAPTARRLRQEGKRVEVVARPGSISALLRGSADSYCPFPLPSGLSLKQQPNLCPCLVLPDSQVA